MFTKHFYILLPWLLIFFYFYFNAVRQMSDLCLLVPCLCIRLLPVYNKTPLLHMHPASPCVPKHLQISLKTKRLQPLTVILKIEIIFRCFPLLLHSAAAVPLMQKGLLCVRQLAFVPTKKRPCKQQEAHLLNFKCSR